MSSRSKPEIGSHWRRISGLPPSPYMRFERVEVMPTGDSRYQDMVVVECASGSGINMVFGIDEFLAEYECDDEQLGLF